MRRYRHSLSNTRLTSFDMGKIIPTTARHVLAGTSVSGGIAAGLELAPMVHQSLTQIRVDTFAISCPDRLIWDDAEDFYTGGATGDVRPEVPYVLAPAETGWAVGSIMDHLGFPTGVPGLKCDARPLRTLIKWYNENCLDLTIQDPLPLSTASGLDITTYTGDLRINWPKDRFTTARKEKTLGDEVVIPVVGNAPVVGTGMTLGLTNGTAEGGLVRSVSASLSPSTGAYGDDVSSATDFENTYIAGRIGVTTDSEKSGLQTASNAVGVLPGEFNFAMGQARWKMRRNLFGSEFRDLLAFWGIKYSDRRLQYAETLAHGRQMVDISAVLQTAPGVNSAVGQVAGRGTGFGFCKYKRYFEEWSTVIHLIVVRPAPVYVNMYPEQWDIEVREDDYTPELAHADLVPIKNKILFPTGNEELDNGTWGFANPYDFKRTSYNDVSGSMKTTAVSYHQGRIFETAPQLNSDFLQCNPSGRIFVVTDEEQTDQIKACAVRNKFIEKSFVTPNGNPKFIGG